MNTYTKNIAESAARLALEHLHHGVCLFDDQGRVLTMNRRFADMYDPSVNPDRTLADYLREAASNGSFEGDPDRFAAEMLEAMRAGKTLQVTHEYPDGRIVLITDTPVEGGGFLSTHEDVTERVKAQREVAHMAKHDLLTDLGNRGAFEEELAAALSEAETKRQQCALIYIDVDRFKNVNDRFGHSVGDAFLTKIAKRLKDVPEGLFIARLGGDEFAIIQPNTQPAATSALMARLQASVAGEIQVGNQVLEAGLSIGAAIYPQDGRDAAILINRADAAMYRAKQAGRGTVRFFEPEMDVNIRERRALESELEGVASRGELTLLYQPQARIDGHVTGFEALVRWQHPRRGLLAPGMFIPLAEENGTISEIGEWVLREACREAAGWQQPLKISVNLSPVQFRRGDLVKVATDALRKTGLDPARLELELTETTLVNDHAHTVQILQALKDLGIRIAMDDFGTGFSSLSYLRSFPFDKIKIDRSFIADLTNSDTAKAIVKGVISLAHGLELPVTAEGVETDEQLRFLAQETCEEVQGFLIGYPEPIKKHLTTLASSQDRRER